jgi:hypothetical protein
LLASSSSSTAESEEAAGDEGDEVDGDGSEGGDGGVVAEAPTETEATTAVTAAAESGGYRVSFPLKGKPPRVSRQHAAVEAKMRGAREALHAASLPPAYSRVAARITAACRSEIYRQVPSVPLCVATKGAGASPPKDSLEATLASLSYGAAPQCPAPPKSPSWRMPPLKDVKCPRPDPTPKLSLLLHNPDHADDDALAALIDRLAKRLAKQVGGGAADKDVEVVFMMDGPMEDEDKHKVGLYKLNPVDP